MEDLEVEPEVLNTPITSLIYAGNWKAMVDTAFDLPVDPTHGEIRPTKSGHLYQFVKDTWVMIGHVMTRPM